jgi:hypothetical protein
MHDILELIMAKYLFYGFRSQGTPFIGQKKSENRIPAIPHVRIKGLSQTMKQGDNKNKMELNLIGNLQYLEIESFKNEEINRYSIYISKYLKRVNHIYGLTNKFYSINNKKKKEK